MARDKNFVKFEFVNYKLTAEDKADFTEWYKADGYDPDALLSHLVDLDMKVSLSTGDDGNTYVTSLVCRDEKSPNYNLCVTSRAATLPDAIAVMLYKQYECMSKVPWRDVVVDDDWG